MILGNEEPKKLYTNKIIKGPAKGKSLKPNFSTGMQMIVGNKGFLEMIDSGFSLEKERNNGSVRRLDLF